MFDIWCHRCQRRVLLWTSNLEALQPSATGMAVFYHCQCGEPGMEVLPPATSIGQPL